MRDESDYLEFRLPSFESPYDGKYDITFVLDALTEVFKWNGKAHYHLHSTPFEDTRKATIIHNSGERISLERGSLQDGIDNYSIRGMPLNLAERASAFDIEHCFNEIIDYHNKYNVQSKKNPCVMPNGEERVPGVLSFPKPNDPTSVTAAG